MRNRPQDFIKKYFDFSGAPILALAVVTLFILESKYSLRKRKVSKIERLKTNAVLATVSAVGLRLVLIPLLVHLAVQTRKRNFGILNLLRISPPWAALLGMLFLDYGNYRWHKLNHEIPWLWRLHQVHHADLDLDVSTALRFHVGEVLISGFYRGMWIALSGVSAKVVLIYEVLFEAATNFHHSNLKLPEKTEELIAKFIVTPRMHGIHHSIVKEETDSNFCIVLTIWDRLHKTLKLDIPQEQIDIGVPYVRDHLRAKELMLLPFKSSPNWALEF